MSVLVTLAVLAFALIDVAAQAVDENVLIKLERTECFGECPIYSVTIDGAGNVTYDGKRFVRVQGRAAARIPVSRVRAILDTAERIHFFDLEDHYREIKNPDGTVGVASDLPTKYVTITIGARSKRVEDYYGTPQSLRELERQIDEAAGTKRWIRIDVESLDQLTSPLAPEELAEQLRKALVADDVPVVKRLLDLGADPNGMYYSTRTSPLMFVRSAAATQALLSAGGIPFARNDNGFTVLHWATHLGPDVTALLLKAGVRVDEPADRFGSTALWYAACGGNVGVVRLLLQAGANPAATGARGISAVACATQGRSDEQRRKPSPLDGKPWYDRDFDQTIAVLEAALAKEHCYTSPDPLHAPVAQLDRAPAF